MDTMFENLDFRFDDEAKRLLKYLEEHIAK